jgi:DNA-binding NarL/FixJ family response regulator
MSAMRIGRRDVVQLGAALERLRDALLRTDPYERGVEDAALVLADALDSACMIALLADDQKTLYPVGLRSPRGRLDQFLEALAGLPFQTSRGYVSEALDTGAPVVEYGLTPERMREVNGLFAAFAEQVRVSAVLVVPLEGRTGPIGVIACARIGRDDRFSPEEVDLTTLAGISLALALESAFLSEALHHAAGRRAPRPRWQPPEERPPADRRVGSEFAGLTELERDVLAGLALGRSNRQVAGDLAVSVRTIEWHRARLQWKLGVSSRAELIEAARASGVAD